MALLQAACTLCMLETPCLCMLAACSHDGDYSSPSAQIHACVYAAPPLLLLVPSLLCNTVVLKGALGLMLGVC
jgi:hypothetical protein